MSSSDDDSQSSDDEYLTTSKGPGDREALIRKKLLESFYGAGGGSNIEASTTTTTTTTPATASKSSIPTSNNVPTKVDAVTPSGPTAKKVTVLDNTDRDDTNKTALKNDRKGGGGGGGTGSGGGIPMIRLARNPSTKDKKEGQSDTSKPPSHSSTSYSSSRIVMPSTAFYDIDSSKFDPILYAKAQFENGSTAQLLETDERLISDVRRLDSTMQTLVYENYSKFIEATDAVRSISRLSSTSTEEKLARLAKGMDRIDRIARTMDEALRSSRDAVTEKLRVKKLLTRLDALLKLPVTLRDYISVERYRQGAKSYLEAIAILGQHSAGFESLRSIELECQSIVKQMLVNLRNSIFLWSGATARWKRVAMNLSDICCRNFQSESKSIDDEKEGEEDKEEDDEEEEEKPDPEEDAVFQSTSRVVGFPSVILSPRESPQSMGEIFECVGTLHMFSTDKGLASYSKVTSNLTDKDCRLLALESCNKYLQKILDEHVVNWNQVRGIGTASGSSLDEKVVDKVVKPSLELAPNHFLHHLLESVRLYASVFKNDKKYMDDHDSKALNDFVVKMFSVFLGHIRHGALDWNTSSENSLESDVDEIFLFISQALSHILRAVREFTSALALPEIGANFDDVSGSLVERTMSIMETVVERQVNLEFDSLRLRTVKECLLPFIQEAVVYNCSSDMGKTDTSSENVLKTIQMGKGALSECMHQLEDAITRTLPKSAKPGILVVDSDFIKDIVKKNARYFAFWIAHCLEALSGIREATSCKCLTLVKDDQNTDDSVIALVQDDDLKDGMDLVPIKPEEQALSDMCSYLFHFAPNDSTSAILLSLIEMCRSASGQIGHDLNSSLVDDGLKGGSGRSDSLFFSPAKVQLLNIDSDHLLSQRLNLAASRIFFIYFSSKGADAASLGCNDMLRLSADQSSDIPVAPSVWACRFLEVVKAVFLHSASTFGDGKLGGPIPSFSDKDMKNMSQLAQIQSHHLAAIKSLQLDVFKNKVKIYPHPSVVVAFSRNYAVCNVFKISLKALCEQCRLCTFTVLSYRQMQVDVEFLRRMTSHYIKEESGVDTTEINQLLDDLLNTAGARCIDPEYIDVTVYKDPKTGEKHSPLSICAAFLDYSPQILKTFIISKDS